MANKIKHTPTNLPWVRKSWTIKDVSNNRVAECIHIGTYKPGDFSNADANAAYIVKAVNAHEKLTNFIIELANGYGFARTDYKDIVREKAQALLKQLEE